MTASVLFRQSGQVAYATLNSEATLNSLTMDMIVQLHPQLEAWAKDSSVAMVVLLGAGEKAFCAGGDIRKLHESITSGKPEGAELFFEREYKLDQYIHNYSKPLLVWGNGIVMGGGLGLMAGAGYRVVTETTKMAMPEITIGLYPDVGASQFLNRMPPGMGLFLGLTGARLNAADCLESGLGNVFVARADREGLFATLEALKWTNDVTTNKSLINHALRPFETKAQSLLPSSELRKHAELIHGFTKFERVEDVAEFFKTIDTQDAWLGFAKKSFLSGSPTSAKVIFEQIRRTRGLSLRECFALEMAMSTQFALHKDLAEGIRALLIDKDNRPQWSAPTLGDVTEQIVNEHFRWPHASRPNPLA
ncbi:MAG: enoyl-CoA hydratase/isomerase family protein [Bdellovibrionales bacterium]|nr:enoyl-CoA hydratase/isomerase family protein [Bdellovibrionales bacterium]